MIVVDVRTCAEQWAVGVEPACWFRPQWARRKLCIFEQWDRARRRRADSSHPVERADRCATVKPNVDGPTARHRVGWPVADRPAERMHGFRNSATSRFTSRVLASPIFEA